MRVNNRDAKACVRNREVFQNSGKTLYAMKAANGFYVVYSYGEHWPLFAWDPDTQTRYGNENRYSRTTTAHRTCSQPVRDDLITWLPAREIKQLCRAGGYVRYTAERVRRLAA